MLRAVTYVLLLISVYAGRTSPTTTPAGSPESIWQNAVAAMRARPGLRAASFALFISVFLVVVVTTTLVTFILPESFVSQARIVLRPSTPDAVGRAASQGTSGAFDPGFVQTECEVIQSQAVLSQAIADLDLNREWGKRYASGERLKTPESTTLLRARMDLRPLPNTCVIEIRVYDERADEAAKVANAIAEAYREHINSPESAAATSRSAHVEMVGMPAPASKPVRPSSAPTTSSGLRVEILDHAVPAYRPIRPNKPLNITLGMLLGLALGLLVGAGAWWVGLQVGTKPGASLQS
jgi:uncharacterized protein involved in exopolysaccharide biosynthesis